ncbi:helix-turn-helix domain-containing protein [Propionibacterium cyclohexanicum]|uniref:helix-turn-helix domain-containing protein n=1 Tax=Propionibacterium cyclohexanicum TaxID=64702 RepID=UPI001FE06424|nr:AraC family transcriptional regulator [Propionibacterium cyclohexanicum]
MKLIFVRSGSGIVFSEFGQRSVALGDVVILGASTLCGHEPHEHLTVTTIYLDPDYMIDQVFWQHSAVLSDRFHAQQFAETVYSEPAQVASLGKERAGMLMPWLDEMVSLTLDGPAPERFYRMQALLCAVLDVLIPYIKTTPARMSASQRARIIPAAPRLRQFLPLRAEAAQARTLLHESPEQLWTLAALAAEVHLSPKQLSRVFVEAYGKTPLAYLTMIRVERMAHLLRDSDLNVTAAGRAVGWASRSRAAEAFRQCVGVTPQEYRTSTRVAR